MIHSLVARKKQEFRRFSRFPQITGAKIFVFAAVAAITAWPGGALRGSMSNFSLPTRSRSTLPERARGGGYGRFGFLPIATALCAGANFVADTLTTTDITFSTLYTVVVLMAARFSSTNGIVRVAVGCAVLAIIAHYLSPPGGPGVRRDLKTTIALTAIGLAALLAVRQKNAEASLLERARAKFSN